MILSTLLYGAEVWLLTGTPTKRLDAAHHRWQRSIVSILGISWKDRITNVEIRAKTGQHTKRKTLRWLRRVMCMNHQSIPQQALYWEVPRYRRGPGRPRTNWRSIVNKDLNTRWGSAGSRNGSSWQTWTASKCGPTRLRGCRMNQGQGQGLR